MRLSRRPPASPISRASGSEIDAAEERAVEGIVAVAGAVTNAGMPAAAAAASEGVAGGASLRATTAFAASPYRASAKVIRPAGSAFVGTVSWSLTAVGGSQV